MAGQALGLFRAMRATLRKQVQPGPVLHVFVMFSSCTIQEQ
jgi:hypothetical protein